MKLKCVFPLFLFALTAMAMKANNAPIALTVNESVTVTLFFPSEIDKVIEPAAHYRFVYEPPHGKMATLEARKGAASNLTVITRDGSIFSFLIHYDNEVNRFAYVLEKNQAIGKLEGTRAVAVTTAKKKSVDRKPETNQKEKVDPTENLNLDQEDDFQEFDSEYVEVVDSEDVTKNIETVSLESMEGSLYDADRESYYEIFCENNYLKKSNFKKTSNTINLIGLHLNNVINDQNDRYFVMDIKNDSWSDFKVKSLKFLSNHCEEIERLKYKNHLCTI